MLRKAVYALFIGGLCVQLCGCVALLAGAAGGAGTAAWLSGKLTQQVNAPFDKSVRAARDGLKAMNLPITKETLGTDVAQFKSAYYDGKTVWVDVRPVGTQSSKIEVRVGMSSDKDAERKVLDSIVHRANSLF